MMAIKLPTRQIHLDFHTGPDIPDVGTSFDAGVFGDMLEEARVNSITLFAKCHHGLLYHATKHPARHPSLPKGLDLLGEQLEVCRKRGIRAPIYLSVQCDEYVAQTEPGWRVVDEKGQWMGAPFDATWHIVDMSSPYQDYLADQIAYVMRNYAPVDEIFLDMCWDQVSCSPYAIAGMQKQNLNPENRDDRILYAHKVSHDYMARYNRLVKDLGRGRVTPIWFNSRAKVQLPVDKKFIRHIEIEALPTNLLWGYSYFPINVRYARTFGLPYLGMTGRFHKDWADFGGLKPKAALLYECAQMLAHGASCSIGDQMHPRGTLDRAAYRLIGDVYRYVEACEPWCQNTTPLTDIAVLRNLNAGYAITYGEVLDGTLKVLQQLRQQFNYLSADDSFDPSGYKVLIVSADIVLTDVMVNTIRKYLLKGGSVLIEAPAALRDGKPLFPEGGVEAHGDSPYKVSYLRFNKAFNPASTDTDHVMYERSVRLTAKRGAQSLGRVVEPYFERAWNHFSSHHQTPADRPSKFAVAVQKGRMITLAYPCFKTYASHANLPSRQLVGTCLDRLLPFPLTKFIGPSHVEVTVNRQGKRAIVHVLSFCPQRRTPINDICEDIWPLVDARLAVRLLGKPKRVTLEPSGEELPFTWEAPYAQVTLNSTRGHDMICLV